MRNEGSSSNEGNRGPSLTLYQNKSREGSVTSKQFGNNTFSLNPDGGGEEVAAWVATSKRIGDLVYVFTPRSNLVVYDFPSSRPQAE
jgi:hypothetical protein